MMSQAIRRSGRVPLAVPRSALSAVDSLWRATRYTELDREQLDYFSYGRVMDTTRMRNDLGYSPKWTTVEAFDDYVRGRGLNRIIDPRWVRSMESRAVGVTSGGEGRQHFVLGGVEGINVAGESKAKVIPLHSNSGRSTAQRRAAAARGEFAPTSVPALRRRQSCFRRGDRRCRPRNRPAPGGVSGTAAADETPSELARRIAVGAEFIQTHDGRLHRR